MSTFSSTSLPFVNLPSPLSTTVSPLESSKFCQPPLTPPAPAATPQPSRIITRIDHIRKHSRQNQNHKGYSQIRPYPETTERYRSSEIGGGRRRGVGFWTHCIWVKESNRGRQLRRELESGDIGHYEKWWSRTKRWDAMLGWYANWTGLTV